MTLTFDPRSPLSSHCAKQPFSENRVHIDASVRLEFCSQYFSDTHTDRQTHTEKNYSENIASPRFRGGVMRCNNDDADSLDEIDDAESSIAIKPNDDNDTVDNDESVDDVL